MKRISIFVENHKIKNEIQSYFMMRRISLFLLTFAQNDYTMNDLTLLYVDDEETNLQLFDLTFSKQFNIVTASTSDAALEIVKNQQIKIVISDYKMPKMNGMELIQEIKKIKPETICMIMSGYVESEVVTDKSLLYRFLMKPWKRQELADTIKEIYH